MAPTGLRVRPNPFRDALSIAFSVSQRSRFDVSVFDVSGRCVRQLHEGDLAAGPAAASISSGLPPAP
ncbi:MAG: hypothetical protein SGI90_03140 [Candidatus Eisenbacteria bacterium]|nr:hypothetical protein [Candidatus Eisenbacteria bacterium]